MDSIREWLKQSLVRIKHEAFKDVVNLELKLKPLDDGQVIIISDTKRVDLLMVKANGEKKLLKAIIKTEADLGAGRQIASDTDAFTTETKVTSIFNLLL